MQCGFVCLSYLGAHVVGVDPYYYRHSLFMHITEPDDSLGFHLHCHSRFFAKEKQQGAVFYLAISYTLCVAYFYGKTSRWFDKEDNLLCLRQLSLGRG